MTHIIARFVTHLPAGVTHGWLYDWQGLVAGLLTLIPAGIIVLQLRAQRYQNKLLRQQIEAEATRVRAERDAKLRVARVTLIPVLGLICEYATGVGRRVRGSWSLNQEEHPYRAFETRVVADPFPIEAYAPLERIIEFSEDVALIERIASIFREGQVLDARTRDLSHGGEATASYLAEMSVEAAVLYARASSLFDFARGGATSVSPTPLVQLSKSALGLIYGAPTPLMVGLLNRDHDTGVEPGYGDFLETPE